MKISFTVYGEPTPKGRPKFFRRGNFVGTYTPDKTKVAEESIQMQSLQHKPEKPMEGPLVLKLAFYRAKGMPSTKIGRQRALAGEIRPTTKPDLDNLTKTVKDALNGIIWIDDAQIIEVFAQKFFSDTPRTEIEITGI